MKQIMENLPQTGWLLGDSGYPLRDYLMTSFNTPATPAEERFNNAHTRTRNVVERAFGVLKSRFRYFCLYKFNHHLLYLISITFMYWMKKHTFTIYIYLFWCLHNSGGCLPFKPENVPWSLRPVWGFTTRQLVKKFLCSKVEQLSCNILHWIIMEQHHNQRENFVNR